MPSSACQTYALDRKSTRLNSSHTIISYAVFCLKKKSELLDRKSTRLNSSHTIISYAVFSFKKTTMGSAGTEAGTEGAFGGQANRGGPTEYPGSGRSRAAPPRHAPRMAAAGSAVFFLQNRATPGYPPFPHPPLFG